MKDCEIALAAVGAEPTVDGALTPIDVAGFVGDGFPGAQAEGWLGDAVDRERHGAGGGPGAG